MTQETFPEIQSAREAVERRLALTEAEIQQAKEDIRTKKSLVRSWRKALNAFSPRAPLKKKKAKAAGEQ